MSSLFDIEALAKQAGFSGCAALLVGVGSSAGVSGERPEAIATETKDLARDLVAQAGYGPSSVCVLLDNEATREGLFDALFALVETAKEADCSVLFCFIGPAIKLTGGGDAGVYLLPFDADPSDIPRTAVSLNELASFFDLIPPGRGIVLFDLFYPVEFIKNTNVLLRRRPPVHKSDFASLLKTGSRVIVASPDAERTVGRKPNFVRFDLASVPFIAGWSPDGTPGKPEIPFVEPSDDAPLTPRSLPATTGTLYPKVSSTPKDYVEPEQEMTFALELSRIAPSGTSAALVIPFAKGAASTVLHASVSSTSFVPPNGETWSATFTVGRDLTTSPERWEFRARALGEQPWYSLTITFVAAGLVVGAVVVTVPRRSALPAGVVTSGEGLQIPSKPGAARLVMKISSEPPGYKIRLYLDGEQVGDAIPWAMSTDPYFSQLEASSSVEDLHAVGVGLWADLPASVTSIIERPDLQGEPMLIVSDTAIAPFEVLRLRPSDETGPLLGQDRPVLRWIDDAPMWLERERIVHEVACIRPEYQPPDALPSAALEEEDLRARIPSLKHIARIDELDQLLNEPGVRLVHFAGHADGNPAKLALQNGSVLPARFMPSKPLLREGRPFMFLNGCRVGRARDATPSSQANIIKFLLKFKCIGAIAPAIPIQSGAALEAARTFYAAMIGNRKSVGDAMLEVRRLAADPRTEPVHRASLMSYLVFAPPGFRLCFEPS